MHDWNRDGKEDFHDDYAYHHLLRGGSAGKQSVSPGCGCLVAAVIILLLLFGK